MTIAANRILKTGTVLARPLLLVQHSSEDIKSHVAATLKEVDKLATVEQLRHVGACNFNNNILQLVFITNNILINNLSTLSPPREIAIKIWIKSFTCSYGCAFAIARKMLAARREQFRPVQKPN